MISKSLVYVVDDDRAVRDSTMMMLQSAGYAVKAYASADEFLAEWIPDEVACLILDVRMPGRSGLELQDLLNDNEAAVPIIFISGHGDVPLSVRAIKSGALDFLEKPFSREQLLQRVGEALDLAARDKAREAGRKKILERLDSLTPREREVLDHVVRGRQNKEIAKLLDISYRTVELHRTRMMEKMAVRCGIHKIPD